MQSCRGIVNLAGRCVEECRSPYQADARAYTVSEVLREYARLGLTIRGTQAGPLDVRAVFP